MTIETLVRVLHAYANRTASVTGNTLVLDGNGNPAYDGLGALGVMTSLGGGPANQSSTQNITSLTYATVPGTSLTFTLSRQVNLKMEYIWTGKITAGAGNGQIRINAGTLGVTGGAMVGVASYITSSAWLFVPAAPAGTYTVQLEANVDAAGTTFNLIQSALQVYQLGA
jgi:hypothetical protein